MRFMPVLLASLVNQLNPGSVSQSSDSNFNRKNELLQRVFDFSDKIIYNASL